LPEICGLFWLVFLAGAVWIHTRATRQPPIYDALSYYIKAYYFWARVQAGIPFNPLNVAPTFRPPGTILMSFPFGFNVDPRWFYFRSVYLPAMLLFFSALFVGYQTRGGLRQRWWAVLTAMFFTTMTLPYHFEFGCLGGVYWGLVDSFLAGLAALVAACIWRGTRANATTFGWVIAVCFISAACIVVKPSGVLVAAIAGLCWVAFGSATLIERRHLEGSQSYGLQRILALRLLLGAILIAVIDYGMIVAAMTSSYLSPQNLIYGRNAIAIMRAEVHLPLSLVWPVVNHGLGGVFILWAVLAIAICATAPLSGGRSLFTPTYITSVLAFGAAVLFGIWFWFVGSAAATEIRYAVPFFMMGWVWLIPVSLYLWNFTPTLIRLAMCVVMLGSICNLAVLLVSTQPSLAWQRSSGVGLTAPVFPSAELNALQHLVATGAGRPREVYVMSLDASDAILESIIDQQRLLHPATALWSLHRPIDWVRSSTIRLNEIQTADTLLVNPQEADRAPPGRTIQNLPEEQGVFTSWANGLTTADGVEVFFSGPSAKILNVINPIELRISLDRMIEANSWDTSFVAANFPRNRPPSN
jgi:hypothetical protein